MLSFFYVALGGAVGAVLRYAVSGWTYHFSSGVFPWGTLAVNLIGSLIIGFLWGVSDVGVVSQNMRLFLFIGIIGSFTTFSTFSLESFSLLRDGEYVLLMFNILFSVVLGIGLVFAGYLFARYFINFLR